MDITRFGLSLCFAGALSGCSPSLEAPPDAEWLSGQWHEVSGSCPDRCVVRNGFSRMTVDADGLQSTVEWVPCTGSGSPVEAGGFEVIGESSPGVLRIGNFEGEVPSLLWGESAEIELREENRCEMTLSFPTPSGGVRRTWIRGRVDYVPLPEGCEGELVPADEEAVDCHEFLSQR